MKKVASLEYGVIFKKAFSDPFVFKAFARDILGLELEIETVETEKEFDKAVGPIQTKFDLFAEDKKNRVIVEIQRERKADHYDRFLYYHCAALLQQAVQSAQYRPPLQVFTIVVLTSGDRHKRDVAITKFDPHDLKGQPLGEFRHQIVFLCPKYVCAETPAQYREWLLAIDDSLDGEVEETDYQNAGILQAFDRILAADVTPQDRARMADEYSDELTIQEKVLQNQLETAQRMLAGGLEVALIAQFTELSETRVKELRNEIAD